MSVFKLPSFLRGKNPKLLIEVFAEPEEEQSHSSGEERSDSAKEVGVPILAEEQNDANIQGQEVPDGRTQGRRRRRKKAQKGNEQG
jgi:hypothetical protein